MPVRWKADSNLFWKCLAASFALHLCFLIGGRLFHKPAAVPPAVEVDLTGLPPLGGSPAKLGAPKKLTPSAAGLPKPAETVEPHKPVLPVPAPPKDWVTPGPQTKVLTKLPEPAPTPGGAPEGSGTAAKTGGFGQGSDYGVPGGTGSGGSGLMQYPRLLNRDELLANMRRFYPESERRAGREGQVLVYLHIGVDGRVNPVDIGHSGGAAFDQAAKEVGRRMIFSPAVGPNGPVAVKLPQVIIFKLGE